MGDFLSTPNKEKISHDDENGVIKYGSCGMQGWRTKMEDGHISDISQGNNNEFSIFGVFDGHGGREVAQFVTAHFTQELLSNSNFKQGNVSLALKETFLKMDELMKTTEGKNEMNQLAEQNKLEESRKEKDNGTNNSQRELISLLTRQKPNTDIAMSTGCTACVCAIDHKNKKMYFANSGDSRVVLCKNGNGIPMSMDHKPELEREKSRIYKADGWINNGRIKGNLNLSRCLGDLEYKQNTKLPPEEQMITANPEIKCEDITNDCEFLVLGCDGIWDCKTNQEACDFVKERLSKNPNQRISGIIEELVESICATDVGNSTGLGCDNMTCIVALFKKTS